MKCTHMPKHSGRRGNEGARRLGNAQLWLEWFVGRAKAAFVCTCGRRWNARARHRRVAFYRVPEVQSKQRPLMPPLHWSNRRLALRRGKTEIYQNTKYFDNHKYEYAMLKEVFKYQVQRQSKVFRHFQLLLQIHWIPIVFPSTSPAWLAKFKYVFPPCLHLRIAIVRRTM